MVKGKTKNHIIIEKVGICRLIPSQSDELYIYTYLPCNRFITIAYMQKKRKKKWKNLIYSRHRAFSWFDPAIFQFHYYLIWFSC